MKNGYYKAGRFFELFNIEVDSPDKGICISEYIRGLGQLARKIKFLVKKGMRIWNIEVVEVTSPYPESRKVILRETAEEFLADNKIIL